VVLGVTVTVLAVSGAFALTLDEELPTTFPSTLDEPSTSQEGGRAHAAAARRAQVMQASRSYQRTTMRGSAQRLERAAARDAAARSQSIRDLYEAAADRSAQIERERARQRRLERQREARQRRIEWMNRWVVPVSNYEITATFGDSGGLWSEDHTGLDFAAPEGTPVMATAAGEVTSTTYDSSYGNQIVVTHDDGTQTWYCHLSRFYVSPGDSVNAGTTIGAVGSTGNATGPHLHLEVHPYGGAAVDPYAYLQERGAL